MEYTHLHRDILRAILRFGQVTRPQLLDALQIRRAALYDAIRELKDAGVVHEPERKGQKTGRRASPVRLRGEHAAFIGIDFRPDGATGILLDADGDTVTRAERPLGPDSGVRNGWAVIESALEALRADAGEAFARAAHIGFADPGLVDVDAGVSRTAVFIPGWEEVPVRERLHQLAGVPALVYPSLAIRAWHEQAMSAGGEGGSLFLLELGMGIGGGFARDGEIFLGDNCSPMEAGHIVIQEDGPLCRCGNRGCLEALAGAAGIRRRVLELVQSGVETRLEAGRFSLEHFVRCAGAGDKAAAGLAHEVAEYVGMGLAAIVTILNPAEIVLTGPLTGLGGMLTGTIERVLSLRCLPLALERLSVRASELPPESTARGAALLAREQHFLHNHR